MYGGENGCRRDITQDARVRDKSGYKGKKFFPIFVVLLGVLFFREKLSAREWAAVALTGAGVLLMLIKGKQKGRENS